jgi:hypothetical protein
MTHVNITAELLEDHIGIRIQIDEDCKVRLDADIVFESVAKPVAHKEHAKVRELMDRLAMLVRASQ